MSGGRSASSEQANTTTGQDRMFSATLLGILAGSPLIGGPIKDSTAAFTGVGDYETVDPSIKYKGPKNA